MGMCVNDLQELLSLLREIIAKQQEEINLLKQMISDRLSKPVYTYKVGESALHTDDIKAKIRSAKESSYLEQYRNGRAPF